LADSVSVHPSADVPVAGDDGGTATTAGGGGGASANGSGLAGSADACPAPNVAAAMQSAAASASAPQCTRVGVRLISAVNNCRLLGTRIFIRPAPSSSFAAPNDVGTPCPLWIAMITSGSMSRHRHRLAVWGAIVTGFKRGGF
jgi:hypothetical protein